MVLQRTRKPGTHGVNIVIQVSNPVTVLTVHILPKMLTRLAWRVTIAPATAITSVIIFKVIFASFILSATSYQKICPFNNTVSTRHFS